tara:strand:- start:64 stop:303 length:240 start_codon:yes stop_codon:yes gene_type:complete
MASPKKKRFLRINGLPGVRGSAPLEQSAPAPEPVKAKPAPEPKLKPVKKQEKQKEVKPIAKPQKVASKVSLKPKAKNKD